MRQAGWSTFWLGKNHSVPVDDLHAGATKESWPLHQGFDRFYGFLGGETNQWYPTLVDDNHYVDQPYQPEEGYHLSKDLADQAIQMIRDVKASAPSTAVVHVVLPRREPRAAPRREGVGRQVQGRVRRRLRGLSRVGAAADDREGRAAGGHRALADEPDARRHVLAARRRAAVGLALGTTRSGCSRAWPRCSPASPSTPTTRSAGSSTTSRRRASSTTRSSSTAPTTAPPARAARTARSTRTSSSTAGRTRWRRTSRCSTTSAAPNTYNHYPTGWAIAFSTPFRMFKRYSYQGGVCDPLVIHWPAGIKAKGEVRHQYHHAIDIVPTILDCCGLEFPETLNGHEQVPLPGVSMRYSFDDADAPHDERERQYYAMLGTRGIWQHGWKAVAVHGPDLGHRPLRRRRVAALPHRRGPRRGARPRRPSIPRS